MQSRICVLKFQEYCAGRSESYANYLNSEITYAFKKQFITIYVTYIVNINYELITEIFLE